MTINSRPWLKNWPPEVPRHIEYPMVPLHDLLHQSVIAYPASTAIIFGERRISYNELDVLTDRFADALMRLDVKRGDRVALLLPNIPQFVIGFFGALKAGAVVTALSPLYREREVEYQLADSGAETIVTLDTLYPIVQAVLAKTLLKNVIVTSLQDYDSQSSTSQPSGTNTLSFTQLIAQSSTIQPNLHFNPEADLAALQYTGGTTGTPKAAMLTHRNLLSNALAFAAWIQGKPGQDTFLTALPLFHIYGMTTSMTVPVSLASAMVLLPKFEPVKALQAIAKHKVTVFCGVPTMYQILLANPELGSYDLTSIRVCISGASSLPPQVQKHFMEVTGGFLAEGYGLSEASPVTHCNPVDPSMRTVKVGSIGLPLPDTEAQIVDSETGKPLPQGETGELAVKGPQVMKGYWRRPEETALALRDGWLLTGDIAHMDVDGYFYVVDRKKDLIKTKDYSVYPRELEDLLYEHPAVKLCAVVGKPDERAGEVPKAYVVLKEGADVSADGIMAFVNGKVASYKALREIEFRRDLPLSSAGKVLKRALKRQYN